MRRLNLPGSSPQHMRVAADKEGADGVPGLARALRVQAEHRLQLGAAAWRQKGSL